jgi:thymidylate kinase
MIVELCGTPAAGKTTTARQLAAVLRMRDYEVELISSFRPAETADNLGPVMASLWRLSRPVRETLAAARAMTNGEQHEHLVSELLHLLPPRNVFWSLRLSQYLLRLLLSWERAPRAHHIVLFDQAFIHGLASLMVLTKTTEPTAIEQAFGRIPKPDMLIRVHAPDDVLRARLSKRRRKQSRFERLLEPDLLTNLRFGPALDVLCGTFDREVGPVVPVHTNDSDSRAAALARIWRKAEGARLTVSDDADAA